MKIRSLVLVSAAVALAALPATAQRRAPGTDRTDRFNVGYDGRYTFVRLAYTPITSRQRGGGGFFGGADYQWNHDWPRADRNFSKILGELTAVEARLDGGNVLSVGDPEIFKYPVAYLVEPGYMTLTDEEADNLRNYLLKGGFLIVDDFADNFSQGPEWGNFTQYMRMVLPEGRFIKLAPDHPLFTSFFTIESLDFYHPYRGVPSQFFGLFEDNDPTKRLLVIANYNNDIGEAWEYSETGFFPVDITNTAYKLGVNYVMYAMTH